MSARFFPCRCAFFLPGSVSPANCTASRSSSRRSARCLTRLIAAKLSPSLIRSCTTTTNAIGDPNLEETPKWTNQQGNPKASFPLPGCDFKHWLVVMKMRPEGSRDEIIESYIKTLAKVVGSDKDAEEKIYSVSTQCYYAFGAEVSEELAGQIKELEEVRWVLPDSYLDEENKDYGGEPFKDGKAVPYDEKYHETWIIYNLKTIALNRKNIAVKTQKQNTGAPSMPNELGRSLMPNMAAPSNINNVPQAVIGANDSGNNMQNTNFQMRFRPNQPRERSGPNSTGPPNKSPPNNYNNVHQAVIRSQKNMQNRGFQNTGPNRAESPKSPDNNHNSVQQPINNVQQAVIGANDSRNNRSGNNMQNTNFQMRIRRNQPRERSGPNSTGPPNKSPPNNYNNVHQAVIRSQKNMQNRGFQNTGPNRAESPKSPANNHNSVQQPSNNYNNMQPKGMEGVQPTLPDRDNGGVSNCD